MTVSAQIALDVANREWARRLDKLDDDQINALADAIGGFLTDSTVNRLVTEKHGPEGEFWPAWSEDHARTRYAGNSLLIGKGHMRDSIRHEVFGNCSDWALSVDAYMLPGATHRFGDEDRGIPACPFLGLSDDDRLRIEDLVVGDLARLLE